MITDANIFGTNLIFCQTKDKKVQELMKLLEKGELKWFQMRNGVVFRKTNAKRLLFYVNERMEDHVVYKYHDELEHIGRDKVLVAIGKSYWFPNMKAKVRRIMKTV